MDAETINKIDWGKISMGFFVGLTFLLQQYHAMQVADIKTDLVPRDEYQRKADTIMEKEEILDAFRDFSKRLGALEDKDGS